MNRRCTCTLGDVGLALLASAALTTWAHGTGIAEGEVCATDNYVDATNGGCNSSPAVFTTLNAGDFTANVASIKGIGSNYNIDTATPCTMPSDCPAGQTCSGGGLCQTNNRDTDWYLITPAALAAADADNNNVVRVQSNVTNATFDVVTFLIAVSDLGGACNASVLDDIGCFDTANNLNNNPAVETILVDEHPEGIVIFCAPGATDSEGCTGGGQFDGFECSTGNNSYNVDFTVEDTFAACADPADNPSLGPCNEANDGVQGCEDPNCCVIVCEQFNAFCCTSGLGWLGACAEAAVDLGCAPAPGGPVRIATGPDDTADGYLAIATDPYGSWSSDTFGGDGAFNDVGWGDEYNPIGGAGPPLDLQEASFTNGFFFFKADTQQRELLSNILNWQNLGDGSIGADDTLERILVGKGSMEFDDNNDGVSDRLESSFSVTGANVDVGFDLTQEIGLVTPKGGNQVAVLTQTVQMTNNSGAPIEFVLIRHGDLDLVWDAKANFADDSVGTNTNGSPLERYVFQQEDGVAVTAITISSADGQAYYGAKNGIDPDGAGPGPAMGFGTDFQQWDAYGVPEGWDNIIAGVAGPGQNGTSGTMPAGCTTPCDGSIGLEIPVALAGAGPSSMLTVVVNTTYGATTPLGATDIGGDCPYDCADMNNIVDTIDFLALLAQWGATGTSCDPDDDGVDTIDFLALLAAWGPC